MNNKTFKKFSKETYKTYEEQSNTLYVHTLCGVMYNNILCGSNYLIFLDRHEVVRKN